ncbi:unnamed protein product [Alopecurus aequalis]
MEAESSSTGKTSELESMMEQLGIKEDDLDDVVFEEVVEKPEEAVRWLAIARVFIEKEFSEFWFKMNMTTAWDLAHKVRLRTLEGIIFTMQFSCLGDWGKVMDPEPWNFWGNPVVLTPYDGFTKPSKIEQNTIKIRIPHGYLPMIKVLASKVGEFIAS